MKPQRIDSCHRLTCARIHTSSNRIERELKRSDEKMWGERERTDDKEIAIYRWRWSRNIKIDEHISFLFWHSHHFHRSQSDTKKTPRPKQYSSIELFHGNWYFVVFRLNVINVFSSGKILAPHHAMPKISSKYLMADEISCLHEHRSTEKQTKENWKTVHEITNKKLAENPGRNEGDETQRQIEKKTRDMREMTHKTT